jgi:hypothetical protein
MDGLLHSWEVSMPDVMARQDPSALHARADQLQVFFHAIIKMIAVHESEIDLSNCG